MKYFAILKDSWREAVDTKVLYVMFALSAAVILILATMSFTPLTAENSFARFFPQNVIMPDGKTERFSIMFLALHNHELDEMNLDEEGALPKILADDGIIGKMGLLNEYELDKVELVHGTADAPESDYALTIIDKFRRPAKESAPDLAKASERVRKVFQDAADRGFIRIGAVTSSVTWPDNDLPGQIHYRVIVHGTPKTFRIWSNTMSLFFGALDIPAPAAPLGYQLYVMTKLVVLVGSWIAILVGVVITSFFIPNMLSKGTIDLLLVKPVHRWSLLVHKYIGGLTFIFLNNAFAIVGIWLVVGLRTGIWPTGSLLLILTLTFFFAILYAISTLVSVLTRSTITSIMLTILAWAAFFSIGWAHNRVSTLTTHERFQIRMGKAVPNRWEDSKLAASINLLHGITPRTAELNRLNDQIVYCDLMSGNVGDIMNFDAARRNWWWSLGVSGGWLGVFLGLACVIFAFKDY